MYRISEEKIEFLRSFNGTIREAARAAGVSKQTAHSYMRGRSTEQERKRYKHFNAADGICRYLRQAERIKSWQEKNGPVPAGQVLASSCHVKYCGNLGHMTLRVDKTAEWNTYKAEMQKFRDLKVGEYFEIPTPHYGVPKLRMGLLSGMRDSHFAVRLMPDRQSVRIYRTGDWWNYSDAVSVAKRLLRHASLKMKHGPIYWFGLLGGSLGPTMHRKEAAKAVRPCAYRGCVFPRQVGSTLCHRHDNFFEYSCSMEWRGLDREDYLIGYDQRLPLFSTMRGWELQRSYQYVSFEHRGQFNSGERLSDQWWKEHVESALANVQASPIVPAWKGYGKKKIRKMMRHRPAGYHGSRPSQKPRTFERESIRTLDQFVVSVSRKSQSGSGQVRSMPECPLVAVPPAHAQGEAYESL